MPVSPDEVGGLPSRTGQFTYLVLILARFPGPGSGLLYLVRDYARFSELGQGFVYLVRDYARFPERGQRLAFPDRPVYLLGFDYLLIFRTKVWIIMPGPGLCPFSRTRSKTCLPGQAS